MKLIIAEKPQLAQVIAEAIGIVKRGKGFFECKDGYTVTNALGHVLQQKYPEKIDPAYEKWSFETLPLKVRDKNGLIPLEPNSRTFDQFKVIKELLKQADSVINAGDPDDEGQLLIDEILDYCNFKGEQYRILINDLDANEAKKALESIKPNSEFLGMKNKALARSQADYLVGLNLTRAYTLSARQKGAQGVFSVGRVQTPTLGLIVRRYLANKNHTQSFFYTITASLNFGESPISAALVFTDNVGVYEEFG